MTFIRRFIKHARKIILRISIETLKKGVLSEVHTEKETRKPSCVNARGIPPAAYQVLTILGGGVPHPRSRGVPCPRSGGYPITGLGKGVPHPRSRGGWGYPQPDLGWGTLPWPDLGWGTPPGETWDGVSPPVRPGMGVPPHNVNRQTFPSTNITFPRTTYAGGKKKTETALSSCGWKQRDASRLTLTAHDALFLPEAPSAG